MGGLGGGVEGRSTKKIFIQGKINKRIKKNAKEKSIGLIFVSETLPTYPSPKPKLCPKWEVSVNVSLGEG